MNLEKLKMFLAKFGKGGEKLSLPSRALSVQQNGLSHAQKMALLAGGGGAAAGGLYAGISDDDEDDMPIKGRY